METKTVTFVKFHPAFSDSDTPGVPVTLTKEAAQKAIDLGVAIAGSHKAVETATVDGGLPLAHSVFEPVSHKAVETATVDGGLPLAHSVFEPVSHKAVETATVDGGLPLAHSVFEPVSDRAVEAATGQRVEAQGFNDDTRKVGSEEGETILPVGTEPDGNKVLIRPEDNELAAKEEAAKKAKK